MPKPARAHLCVLLYTALFSCLSACCPPQLGRLSPYTPDEVDTHLKDTREKAIGGFAVLYVAPFAIAGQGPRDSIKEIAQQVVGISAAFLKKEYFPRDPKDIVTLWMFEGETSYRSHVNRLFGGVPPSPYGYYDPCNDILAADISLGLGTVIHEMVHAFMEANFPDCPAWFNEGLASLYEHTETEDGRVRGLVNWRLPPLKASIQRKKLPSLDDLLATSSGEFYGDRRGTYYAMARYLMYYLQEKKLLSNYYHRFLQTHSEDPTGKTALLEVLRIGNLDAFQRQWETFVTAL